ncbi:hypothetical protein TNCT_483251 [Trichonephila clavata]|uniref:Uncharacterized protein n=1 Tax=Trichonephila clavata TaxID=2740835 RepID=A0A8X6F1D1_TRICU|nr:hypothetical protein TNCT_483251 [Trichonephila clavata]
MTISRQTLYWTHEQNPLQTLKAVSRREKLLRFPVSVKLFDSGLKNTLFLNFNEENDLSRTTTFYYGPRTKTLQILKVVSRGKIYIEYFSDRSEKLKFLDLRTLRNRKDPPGPRVFRRAPRAVLPDPGSKTEILAGSTPGKWEKRENDAGAGSTPRNRKGALRRSTSGLVPQSSSFPSSERFSDRANRVPVPENKNTFSALISELAAGSSKSDSGLVSRDELESEIGIEIPSDLGPRPPEGDLEPLAYGPRLREQGLPKIAGSRQRRSSTRIIARASWTPLAIWGRSVFGARS